MASKIPLSIQGPISTILPAAILPFPSGDESVKNLWNDEEARQYSHSPLAMRVYTSRLLGRDPDLVLHGGGNTSVKATRTNLFGEAERILFVKGSGWDLRTIEEPGFAPARLTDLLRLATLESLSDTHMVRELRKSLIDPTAPSPSVETILHALIPFDFVDHTHADAVVAISNTPDGEARIRELYGPSMLVLPYAMPGFILAQQVYQATRGLVWEDLAGIILLHHGVFTFSDFGRESYERMIAIVNQAEEYLATQEARLLASKEASSAALDTLDLARLRRATSEAFGAPVLARAKEDPLSVGFASLPNVAETATRGPLTPDHVIQTKRIPLIVGDDPADSVSRYGTAYGEYFARHASTDLTMLDPAPRAAIWPGKALVALGPNIKRTRIISDLMDHTLKAIQNAEALNSWEALSEREVFDLEYWELEQAKLKRGGSKAPFEGQVALVTGGASGIGRSTVEALLAEGACVIALDIAPEIETLFASPAFLGLVTDVTSTQTVRAALDRGVRAFGGLDLVVSNAGSFPPSQGLEAMDDDAWERCLSLNLSSHMRVLRESLPFLRLGLHPAVVFVASKNVPAPGPGAGAYSTAKAGLTQLARVAALECGGDGIRVNTIHPNAVFDTGVWTDEVLQSRSQSYGLTVEEYKRNNVLKTEVTAFHVARLIVTLLGPAFAKTTGAQIPIDGGNERVI